VRTVFTLCVALSAADRELLDAFAAAPAGVREALRGLDAGTMNRRPGDAWSVRDVVVHLSDAELVRAFRIRMMLAEDAPLITNFDEGAWQRRLQYLWRSPEAALALYELTCFSTAEILRNCDSTAFLRTGTHIEDGLLDVRSLVERGVRHAAEHRTHIEWLRETIRGGR
jgi:hypothetical protein